MKLEWNGIEFYRTGECKRCGACEKKHCAHFSMEGGIATCDTYGKGDYLERNCERFPDNPFCRVVQEGTCGYRFEPITDEDVRKYDILVESIKRSKA